MVVWAGARGQMQAEALQRSSALGGRRRGQAAHSFCIQHLFCSTEDSPHLLGLRGSQREGAGCSALGLSHLGMAGHSFLFSAWI